MRKRKNKQPTNKRIEDAETNPHSYNDLILTKVTKTCGEKRVSLIKSCRENQIIHIQENETSSPSLTCTNANSKYIKTPSKRPKVATVRKLTGETLELISTGKKFLNKTLKTHLI